jgi:hypothetical protein
MRPNGRAGRLHQTAPLTNPRYPQPRRADESLTDDTPRLCYSAESRKGQLGERHTFACPSCGSRKANFAWKFDRDGIERWFIGTFSSRCPGGAECLRGIADAVGTGAGDLLDNPRPFLEPYAVANRHGQTVSDRSRAALPSIGSVHGWHERLLIVEDPLTYVFGRGLSVATLVRYGLGFDGTHLTLPVYGKSGEIVNLRRRLPQDGARPRGLRGRGSQLYPDVPRRGSILLVAGEFDALIGRQLGLPTVTTTCGATLPLHLGQAFAGRRVAVMYDVGEEIKAAKTVALLTSLKAKAWSVRLAELGLGEGGDLNAYYLDGGTKSLLVDLVRREGRFG